MPVCKFFARGNCRKGNYCNFEHVIPDDGYGRASEGTSVLRRNSPSSGYESARSYSPNSGHGSARSYSPNRNYDNRGYDSGGNYGNYQGYDSRSYDRGYENKNIYHTDNRKYNYDSRGYNDRGGSNYTSSYREKQNNYSSETYIDCYGNASPRHYNYQTEQRYQPPRNDKYHYDSRQNDTPNIQEMYKIFKQDISGFQDSHIWPLSSLCLIKMFGSFEGWYDYSPEELRLGAYIARDTNNQEGYKITVDRLISRVASLCEKFKNTSKEVSAQIKAYMLQSGTTIYPLLDNELDFSQVNFPTGNFINPSEFAAQNGNLSPFLGENQVQTEDMEMASTKFEGFFGQNSPPRGNVFGFNQDVKPSVFGTSTNSEQTPNTFGFSQDMKPSGFGILENVQPSNIFGFPQESSNIFGLAGRSSPPRQTNRGPQIPRDISAIYPNLKQTDLDMEIVSYVWRGDSPYSQGGSLMDEEIEQFKANKFTIGKIPLVPPTKELS